LSGKGYAKAALLPSIQQWIDFKLTGLLPRAGGTLDQDPEFMRDFRKILSVEAEYKERDRKMAEIHAEIRSRTGRK